MFCAISRLGTIFSWLASQQPICWGNDRFCIMHHWHTHVVPSKYARQREPIYQYIGCCEDIIPQVQPEFWNSGSVGQTARHGPGLQTQQGLRETLHASGVGPCSPAHPRLGWQGKDAVVAGRWPRLKPVTSSCMSLRASTHIALFNTHLYLSSQGVK